MHLDINPSGAQSQFFEPRVIFPLIEQHCLPPCWEGELLYEKETGKFVGLEERPNGPLQLWVRPNHHGSMPVDRYCSGVDIAAGTGASPSCVSLARKRTGDKVAAYVNPNLSPEAFAPVVAALGRLFSDADAQPAYCAWEASGGPGEAFAKALLNMSYANVYYRETPMAYAGMRKSSDKPGWYSTPNSKRVLLEEYRSALANRRFLNPCEVAMRETLKFRYTGDTVEHPGELSPNDPSGARVNHGDRVIADALCSMLCDKQPATREPMRYQADPQPGSWDWRRKLGDEADREELAHWD